MKASSTAPSGPGPALSRLHAAGREALAYARQATLLHRDVTLSYPKLAEPGQDVVVLLHGLFATAGVSERLAPGSVKARKRWPRTARRCCTGTSR